MYRLPPSVLFLVLFGFSTPLVFGQSHALSKTDLGKSQNTAQDLQNSLVPGAPKFGKGEKKEEVDPKKLPSKKSNDTLFAGGLNDLGVNWSGDKMGKPHTGREAESKTEKATSAVEKDSKVTTASENAAATKAKDEASAAAAKTEQTSAEKEKASTAAK